MLLEGRNISFEHVVISSLDELRFFVSLRVNVLVSTFCEEEKIFSTSRQKSNFS